MVSPLATRLHLTLCLRANEELGKMNNKENKIWHIRRLIEFTFVAMVHLIPEMGFAQYFVGPVAAGSGGAGVAAAEPGEGALLNPAILSHAPDFSGSTFYRDGYVGEGHHLTQLGFMLVDNSKGVFCREA